MTQNGIMENKYLKTVARDISRHGGFGYSSSDEVVHTQLMIAITLIQTTSRLDIKSKKADKIL